jgi:predicted phage baseplate assembly protein
MPLPIPVLDNRTWAELTAEGRTLIPKAAASWTDHNVHDPGITLMELFAWLSEMLIYRLDRVSPATVRAFLRLAGVEPAPPQVATTVLAARLDPGGALVVLPAGTQVADPRRLTVFESPDALLVSPAWIELSAAETTSRGAIRVVSGGRSTDHLKDNGAAGFWAFGPAPKVGDWLQLGFDIRPAGPGGIIRLHFWTPTWAGDDVIRQSLLREAEEAAAECSSGAAQAAPCDLSLPPAPTGHEPPPPPLPWWLHYSARTAWEYWAGADGWKAAHVVEDRTRALTLSGFVTLTEVAAHQPGPGDGRYWFRCRLVSGAYECPPRVVAVGVNAFAVHHAAHSGAETLGGSRGEAGQQYRLSKAPVVAGSTQLSLVSGPVSDDTWREVLYWDRSGPLDHHYRLDPEAGTITFGNGRTGFVPPADLGVEALEYEVGGGSVGNAPAGVLSQIVTAHPPSISVMQPFDAVGGAGAESLDHAHGRALDDLIKPVRAVTTGDIETLARETPGVPVARAAAWPGYHASYPCMQAPGVVTVVVLPACGKPPTPGPDFLAAVRAYLNRRRPLTMEILVVGPTYVPVTVSATLHTSGLASDLIARAQGALETFFDPLNGGPDGGGWPFGRAVIESEVMSLLNGLPGVAFVDQLGLTGADPAAVSCVNLSLCPTELVASQTHRITVVGG